MEVAIDIDVTGKVCPGPLIAIAKAMKGLAPGDLLRVTGDDPLFEESVTDLCAEGGHELFETRREGKRVSIVIRKGTEG